MYKHFLRIQKIQLKGCYTISTDFATKHILLKVGNKVAMIAASAENRTAFSAQWIGEEPFYVLA